MKLRPITKQSGFSLIELMIAILLSTFITAGLIKLFVNSKQIYRVQESLSRLQEDGRFAVNFLTRDLRMAGYWGCLSNTTNIASDLNPGSAYDNFSIDVTGSDNSGINGSDSITISGSKPSGVFVVTIPASTSAALEVTDNSGLKENDVVVVSDCEKGDIFQITNDPTTGSAPNKDELVHNTGGKPAATSPAYPGNVTKIFQKVYGTDAQIYKINVITYHLATGSDGRPALFRTINGTSKELIPDIENMQILYGEDTDNDYTANRYVPASTSGLNFNHVVSIRLALVVATAKDNIATAPVPYTIFGHTYTPTDKRLRRVFTTTIAVRNKLL